MRWIPTSMDSFSLSLTLPIVRISTATLYSKTSDSLRETNEILVIYNSHASWDEFQNTSKTGFILMPLVEMNTTHEGFILERQNLQQNSKTWSECLLIRSNEMNSRVQWGSFSMFMPGTQTSKSSARDELPRPMGFILKVHPCLEFKHPIHR